jgi:lipopolysaccharide export system permease protein
LDALSNTESSVSPATPDAVGSTPVTGVPAVAAAPVATSAVASAPVSAPVIAASSRRPGVAPHAVPRPWRKRFRLPLKIADSYLLSSVIGGTLRGLCWFAGLLFAFAVISAVRRVVTDNLPLGLTIRIVICQMPRILLFTLPMSLLYGTVQTFSDLSTRGELTALGVGGMSLPRMVRAPIGWGVLLAILAFWLQEGIVPRAERRGKEIFAQELMNAAGTQQDFLLVDQNASNRIERLIQADLFDPKSRTLINPSIQLFNEKKEIVFDVRADRAQWDIAAGKWVFYNGATTIKPPDQGATLALPSRSKFTELAIDVLPNPKILKQKSVTLQENLDKKNYEMLSISDLRAYLRKQPELLERVTYPNIQKKISSRIKSLTFGIHDKIATPLICIVLVLVGAPLGVRPQRSGGGFAMGLSLAVLLLYYIVWSWVSQIGKAGYGDPYILAYSPLVLTLVIGLVLMKMKSR